MKFWFKKKEDSEMIELFKNNDISKITRLLRKRSIKYDKVMIIQFLCAQYCFIVLSYYLLYATPFRIAVLLDGGLSIIYGVLALLASKQYIKKYKEFRKEELNEIPWWQAKEHGGWK